MAAFAKDISNAVWHAFDALDDHRNGRVMKSRLKVLTASLGTLLGCQNVEKGLQEHRSTQDLCFDDFLFYLQKELFSFLYGLADYKALHRYHDQIEEVCWLVCKKKFLRRDYVAFPDNCVFQFFRVFCLLGELHQEPKKPIEVLLAAEEVEHVAMMFNHALGQNWDSADFQGIAEVIPLFRFQVFIALLESRYTQSVEVKGLIEATKEVFDIFVNDVLKKGSLRKRIARLGIWRELWFVLQPNALTYYSNKEEGDKRGELQLTTKSRVETLPSSPSGKGFRFSVMSGDKILDLSAPDHKNKLQWIIALQTAFQFSQASESYQRHLANKRKSDRLLAKAKKEEEEASRLQQQQQLEYLTKARIEAEEAIQAESQRRHVLEEEQRKLERQLEEERQAKRDEEIVRNLLSKSLMEEWEHRERLERIKAEKEKRLAEEQKRRLELETWQRKKEDENEQFVKRLSNLETEKLELHSTLQKTQKMLAFAEHASQTLKRTKAKKHNIPLRRVHSVDLSSQIRMSCWIPPTATDHFSSSKKKLLRSESSESEGEKSFAAKTEFSSDEDFEHSNDNFGHSDKERNDLDDENKLKVNLTTNSNSITFCSNCNNTGYSNTEDSDQDKKIVNEDADENSSFTINSFEFDDNNDRTQKDGKERSQKNQFGSAGIIEQDVLINYDKNKNISSNEFVPDDDIISSEKQMNASTEVVEQDYDIISLKKNKNVSSDKLVMHDITSSEKNKKLSCEAVETTKKYGIIVSDENRNVRSGEINKQGDGIINLDKNTNPSSGEITEQDDGIINSDKNTNISCGEITEQHDEIINSDKNMDASNSIDIEQINALISDKNKDVID